MAPLSYIVTCPHSSCSQEDTHTHMHAHRSAHHSATYDVVTGIAYQPTSTFTHMSTTNTMYTGQYYQYSIYSDSTTE